MSPRIVLNECGVDFSAIKVDLRTKQTESGVDYLTINPKGYVPALELNDGTLLTEGPAIIQWIADQNPKSNLAPANGTLPRYQLQSWLNFISTELHKSFSPLFDKTAPELTKQKSLENISKRFDYVVKQMGSNPYLAGQQFTVADAYLFTVLMWTKFVNVDLTPWPTLLEYVGRIMQRPAVRLSLEQENLLRFF